jgi:hypothetical protein
MKKLKIKNLLDILFYLQIDDDLNFMQFQCYLLLHQGPLELYTICSTYNLTVVDGLSNDNKNYMKFESPLIYRD